MPWVLSDVPMMTAFDRVKQATVQVKRAARTSSSEGFRAETTSREPGPTIFESNLLWTSIPPATRLNSRPLSPAGTSSGAPIRTTRRTLRVARTDRASGVKSGA